MPEVVYTLGNPKGYDPDLAAARQKGERIHKLGRTENYGGGIMFKTPEEARAYSTENALGYEPYGVLLPQGWDTDVDASRTQEDYDCLLVNAEILTLKEVRLIQRLQQAGFAATWHKIEPATILGGAKVHNHGGFESYEDAFTLARDEEGFRLRILGQLIREERISSEDEVLARLQKHYPTIVQMTQT